MEHVQLLVITMVIHLPVVVATLELTVRQEVGYIVDFYHAYMIPLLYK